jgi:DNA-directed RNA polymerase subunit RPC12/RpoP
MPSNPKTVPLNWEFSIECVDCGTEFTLKHVDPTVERLEHGNRMALVVFPNECPKCHNLRVVKEGESQP